MRLANILGIRTSSNLSEIKKEAGYPRRELQPQIHDLNSCFDLDAWLLIVLAVIYIQFDYPVIKGNLPFPSVDSYAHVVFMNSSLGVIVTLNGSAGDGKEAAMAPFQNFGMVHLPPTGMMS